MSERAENAAASAIAVCFVCSGNICRSPTAEGILRGLVREARLDARFRIDSAGTHSYHSGEQPDPRTVSAARARGIHLVHAARMFVPGDFDRFEHVIALDRTHEVHLARLAAQPGHRDKITLLRRFESGARDLDVPDPYYGGASGFEEVLDICDRACRGLLAHLRSKHGI